MLPHSICTGSHSRIGPERGHLHSHLQGVPVVPGREEPHGLPAIPGNSDGLRSQHLLIHPGNRGGDGQGGRAREMPSHSVQNATHPLGLHFLEILALGLLTFHTIFHGHAIFNYLKKAWLKRRQDQADADLAKAEAERLKMEKEINEQVAARLKKEKVENKFNPDISLAPA